MEAMPSGVLEKEWWESWFGDHLDDPWNIQVEMERVEKVGVKAAQAGGSK